MADDIAHWLEGLGLGKYARRFAQKRCRPSLGSNHPRCSLAALVTTGVLVLGSLGMAEESLSQALDRGRRVIAPDHRIGPGMPFTHLERRGEGHGQELRDLRDLRRVEPAPPHLPVPEPPNLQPLADAADQPLFVNPESARRVIYALPADDSRLRPPGGEALSAMLSLADQLDLPTGDVVSLQSALAAARAGDMIQMLPGVYPVRPGTQELVFPRGGEADQPITLRGLGQQTVIRGTGERTERSLLPLKALDPEREPLFLPRFDVDTNCILIENREWITIDNIMLQDCGDAAVHTRNSSFISLTNAHITGGRYAFLAVGRRSHHFLLEGNQWFQDPQGAMWTRNHWCEYKHSSKGQLTDLNGAFFGSVDIAGGVVVRDNAVHHAFNAIRMDVDTAALVGKVNYNVEIYGNTFTHIRDNVVEPEVDATNWWVFDNDIRNAHAWFSFDGKHGGRWYILENRGWWDDKPSRECADNPRCAWWRTVTDAEAIALDCADPHAGGRVLKFRQDAPSVFAPGPLSVVNNSWYLRASVIRNVRLGDIRHINNAIGYCRRADFAAGDWRPAECDPAAPYFDGVIDRSWDYEFEYDLSNHPDFPKSLQRSGYQVDGVQVPFTDPVFENGWHGRLGLATALGEKPGCVPKLNAQAGYIACDPDQSAGTGLQIGAPPRGTRRLDIRYRHDDGAPYLERPRVIDVDWPPVEETDGGWLTRVFFSIPIQVTVADPQLIVDPGGGGAAAVSRPCTVSEHQLRCAFAPGAVLPGAPPAALLLPKGVVGTNGQPLTLWAKRPAYVGVQ